MMSVHPRVCGEHVVVGVHDFRHDGSSPRLRGTLRPKQRRSRDSRFIPASAGNTLLPLSPFWLIPVHPRVCGEHGVAAQTMLDAFGSSPRLRGTHKARLPFSLHSRFIPASAGNTVIQRQRMQESPVHPRVCGEHSGSGPFNAPVYGSSPRLRGTRRPYPVWQVRQRFIPASAGNTLKTTY